MKIYVHSWSYLAELLLEWEMFRTEFVENIVTHAFMFNNVVSKVVPFMS
jgi:hypothetical protein